MSRATNAELIKRRQEIQQLILKGMTGSEIQERMSIKYKTSKRAIAEDMRNIAKDWQEQKTEDSQLMRNKYADRLELLFCKAVEDNNVKAALDVQKEIHKLNDIYKEAEDEKDKIPEFINVGRRSSLKVVPDDE